MSDINGQGYAHHGRCTSRILLLLHYLTRVTHMNFLIALATGIALVATVIFVHANVIRVIRGARTDDALVSSRLVGSLFITHIVEVGIFAAGLFVTAEVFDLGSLQGIHEINWRNYMYFSIETYTSLGLGDIYPTGELRMLAGFEVLTGLMMIGWSASFVFVEMRAAVDQFTEKAS